MSRTTPPESRPAKAMSSRLMTMKFMQRAAASTPPSTSQSQTQHTDTPPSKRQKRSNGTPSVTTTPAELEFIRSALEEEEGIREKAIERLAEEAGETQWVFSSLNGGAEEGARGLRVALTGYSDIDSDASRATMEGRMSFGKFNREPKKRQNNDVDGSSPSDEETSESSEDGDENDDPASTGELIDVAKQKAERIERKQQRSANKAEVARLAEQRRSKAVNLNKLSAISAGGMSAGKLSGKNKQECYLCGLKGHERRDCPQKAQRRHEDGRRGGNSKGSRPSLEY